MTPQIRFPQFTDEWQAKRLGDVVEFKNGKPFEDYVSKDGEYHLITIDSVDIEGNLKSKFKKVTKSDNSLQKNDIVTVLSDIAHGNLLGLTSLIPADRQFVLNQRMGRLRPKDGSSARFISHYINTKQAYYRKRGQGTSQRHIYERDINQMIVNMPMAKEQEKIAEFLTVVDERIGKIEKKLELLQQYKKGVMQKIFTQQIRFKNENGNPYPEWEEKKLREVIDVNPRTDRLPDKFIYIDLESVNSGRLLSERLVNKIEAPSRAQRLLNKNDILFQTVRPYQRNNFYFDRDGDYVASTGYAQLRYRECPQFIYQLIHTDDFVNKVLDYCTGTNYPAISSNDLGKIVIGAPGSLEEQQKIATFLTALDDKIKVEQTRLTAAKQWKKGLLQRMFV